ncbi:hypothetical protein M673_06030 [Aureimonas sp. AU20]|nr:hypothetical protein M673_06030 [Aureimonas sp. AU20]
MIGIGHDHSDEAHPVASFLRYVQDEEELKAIAAEGKAS